MSELGYYTLRIALVIAGIGIVTGFWGGAREREDLSALARRALWLCTVLVAIASGVLVWALVVGDMSITYVARQSARSMPLFYRVSAWWGGQAGSLLLWLLISLIYASAAVGFQRAKLPKLVPYVCAILLVNGLFFLVLVNFFANPFEKLPPDQVLSDGSGLNPLLQHPLMVIHPVMLYSGFTGFSVPFAFAFAALMTGELSGSWLRATRRLTLVPWFFLSIGILLGGRWAYEVLGWGGYWAWDPVENASFMPWLAATAYLHSVMIQEKRNMLRIWNLVLVGLTYSLCLFGTFLTRSGVISSVHSFAASNFGSLFLIYVLIAVAAYFALLIYRRRSLRSENELESLASREASFVLNNWLFMAILAIVLWGTLFPVLSEAIQGVKTSVGPKFFNRLAGPFAAALMLLTGVGPLIAWRKASSQSLVRHFRIPTTVGVLVAIATVLTLRERLSTYPVVFWSFAAFVVTAITQEFIRAIRARRRRGEGSLEALRTLFVKNQRRYGGYVVHLGVVFILLGFSGAAFNEDKLENLRPGQQLDVGQYSLHYLTATALPEGHYGGAAVRLALYHRDDPLVVMVPERRFYWLEQQPSSIPSIYSTIREDLYVILTALEPDGSATLKVHRNPLVNWIWIGGYTFVLGAILVLWPHPARRQSAEGAAQ